MCDWDVTDSSLKGLQALGPVRIIPSHLDWNPYYSPRFRLAANLTCTIHNPPWLWAESAMMPHATSPTHHPKILDVGVFGVIGSYIYNKISFLYNWSGIGARHSLTIPLSWSCNMWHGISRSIRNLDPSAALCQHFRCCDQHSVANSFCNLIDVGLCFGTVAN